MPCESGESSYSRDIRHHDALTVERTKRRELMALLCTLCTAWVATFGTGTSPAMPPSVQAWWRKHQARDQRRAKSAEARAAKSRRDHAVEVTRLERQRAQITADLKRLRKVVPSPDPLRRRR